MPSQEWLLRVAKTKKIGLVNEVTIVAIQSGYRENSYKNRDYLENEIHFELIKKDPEKLLKKIYYDQYLLLKQKDSSNIYHLRAIIRNWTLSILSMLGLTLGQVIIFLKSPRKGEFINQLRKQRGLQEI